MVKLDVIIHLSITGILLGPLDIVILDVIIADLALELREIIIIMVALYIINKTMSMKSKSQISCLTGD